MIFYIGLGMTVLTWFVEIVVVTTVNKEVKGWFNPNAIDKGKYHYFIDGVSLCLRWTVIQKDNAFDDILHYHSENCLNCVRARDKKFGKAEL